MNGVCLDSCVKYSIVRVFVYADKEGVICRALLAGNIELAVDLCVQEARMTDAIILAHSAGPDVLAKTQYKYFQVSILRFGKIVVT